jgi:ribonuclease-3
LVKDKSLETAVFTHQGVVGTQRPDPSQEISYDRLEVLGDAYIEVIATRLIWDQFKALQAGQLCQARELLVKNETLAEYATRYGFDKRARVPPDQLNHPKRWEKTKGDIFEAYVAAIILSDPEHGVDFVEDWLTQLWLPKLKKDFRPAEITLDAKQELTKMVMGKGVKLNYVDEKPMVRNGGLQTFFIGVYLTGWGWTDQHLGSGVGLNKVVAGNEAAKQALANKPLINEIHAAKTAFYEKVRAEREQAAIPATS